MLLILVLLEISCYIICQSWCSQQTAGQTFGTGGSGGIMSYIVLILPTLACLLCHVGGMVTRSVCGTSVCDDDDCLYFNNKK